MKIPIKKYVMDETLTWKERYKQLEKHHEEETKYLISLLKEPNPYKRAGKAIDKLFKESTTEEILALAKKFEPT